MWNDDQERIFREFLGTDHYCTGAKLSHFYFYNDSSCRLAMIYYKYN